MGKVRSRAAVMGVATGAMVIALLPVASLAQVPSVDQVVGGVTDTVGGVVPPPPSLPTNPLPANPLPSQPPAVSAPAVQAPAVQPPAVQAPAVKAPAPAPSVQAPAGSGSAPQRQQSSAPAGSGGSAGATPSDPGGGNTGGARHSRARSHTSRAGRTKHHAQHGSSHANAAADPSAQGAGSTGGNQLAMADKAAAPLPDEPRPAQSPFTGLALGLLLWAGLSALGLGFAIHRGAVRLHFRRAV